MYALWHCRSEQATAECVNIDCTGTGQAKDIAVIGSPCASALVLLTQTPAELAAFLQPFACAPRSPLAWSAGHDRPSYLACAHGGTLAHRSAQLLLWYVFQQSAPSWSSARSNNWLEIVRATSTDKRAASRQVRALSEHQDCRQHSLPLGNHTVADALHVQPCWITRPNSESDMAMRPTNAWHHFMYRLYSPLRGRLATLHSIDRNLLVLV